MPFGVNNCRDNEALRFNYFSKCSKFNVKSKNTMKDCTMSSGLYIIVYNCIWIGNGKLSELWPEYSSRQSIC